MSFMRMEFRISPHAVEQYRDRVLACPERTRSERQLRSAIKWQLAEFPMQTVNKCLVISGGPWRPKKKKPWQLTLNYTTHMFVVDGSAIVTTLGFMMRPKKATSIKARAKRRALAYRLASNLPRDANT